MSVGSNALWSTAIPTVLKLPPLKNPTSQPAPTKSLSPYGRSMAFTLLPDYTSRNTSMSIPSSIISGSTSLPWIPIGDASASSSTKIAAARSSLAPFGTTTAPWAPVTAAMTILVAGKPTPMTPALLFLTFNSSGSDCSSDLNPQMMILAICPTPSSGLPGPMSSKKSSTGGML